MKPANWFWRDSGKRMVSLALVALLLVGALTTPVAAAPSMYLSNANVQGSTVLVGENVTVTAQVKNLGDDSGGYSFEFKRNGSRFASQRVVVEADSSVKVTESVSFGAPGTYEIRVNDRVAGIVDVQRAKATVANEDAARRTVDVRARSVPTNEPYTLEFPTATNRSFAVEAWTVETSESTYDQQITEYTDPSAADFSVPADSPNTVASAFTVDSSADIERATVRFTLNRSRLRALELPQNDVTLYHRNGSTWDPLETTLVEERTGSVVYEATATEFSTFAVGRIEPEFSVEDTALRTRQVDDGQRLILEAIVRNNGSVDGEYEATLYVNDEQTNTTTVTVPAGTERTVVLSHDVSSAGSYELAMNDEDAGSIVLSEGQVSDDTETAADAEGTDSRATVAENPDSDGGLGVALPAGVPETVVGIDTVYLGGGIGVALVVFFGLVLLLRRGGGGNSGGFEQL